MSHIPQTHVPCIGKQILFFKNDFIYLFLAGLGLHCCSDFSLGVLCGLLPGGFSCGARAPGCTGSVAAACGLTNCGSWAL